MAKYLSNRSSLVNKEMKIQPSVGVPQGSVLDPVFWNLAFNDLLSMSLSKEVKTVVSADDLVLVAISKTYQ